MKKSKTIKMTEEQFEDAKRKSEDAAVLRYKEARRIEDSMLNSLNPPKYEPKYIVVKGGSWSFFYGRSEVKVDTFTDLSKAVTFAKVNGGTVYPLGHELDLKVSVTT